MKKLSLGFGLLILGVLLSGLIFLLINMSSKAEQRADTERDLMLRLQGIDPDENHRESADTKPEDNAGPWDPEDPETSPPGAKSFTSHDFCRLVEGNDIRSMCAVDPSQLDPESPDIDAETSERIYYTLGCLEEVIEQSDEYATGQRIFRDPVDTSDTAKQEMACRYVDLYGDNPAFEEWEFFYIVKEHMESGNIMRLED